jgi:LmbE family N-acetylglucosaminyl deacetylase
VLAFDTSGVTGHADHAVATAAACGAAELFGLPVLGWALTDAIARAMNSGWGTEFHGYAPDALDFAVPVDRSRQCAAIGAHASQAVAGSLLWRRLELQGDVEHLRWLRRPDPVDRRSKGASMTRPPRGIEGEHQPGDDQPVGGHVRNSGER